MTWTAQRREAARLRFYATMAPACLVSAMYRSAATYYLRTGDYASAARCEIANENAARDTRPDEDEVA